MDLPCIAMNEPPKFGKKQVSKRASRSSHGREIPWELHLGRELHPRYSRSLWGTGMASGQPGPQACDEG